MRLSRRQALLGVLALPLADARMLARSTGARLTIPLDQWGTLVFTLKGRTVEYSVAEVFAVLKGDKA